MQILMGLQVFLYKSCRQLHHLYQLHHLGSEAETMSSASCAAVENICLTCQISLQLNRYVGKKTPN